MCISKLSIIIGGLLSLFIFLFHTKFYKLFGWHKEFTTITVGSRKILYTVNMALYWLFLFFAIISFVYVNELATCKGLAFGICLGYSLFWLWRTIWQFIYSH